MSVVTDACPNSKEPYIIFLKQAAFIFQQKIYQYRIVLVQIFLHFWFHFNSCLGYVCISTISIKNLYPILCLLIFKGTKKLSLGGRDKFVVGGFFALRWKGTILKFENTACPAGK